MFTVSTDMLPVDQRQARSDAMTKISKMVEVMGWRAVGAKLMDYSKSVEMEWEKREEDNNKQPELF